jgi:hypothetical protein
VRELVETLQNATSNISNIFSGQWVGGAL